MHVPLKTGHPKITRKGFRYMIKRHCSGSESLLTPVSKHCYLTTCYQIHISYKLNISLNEAVG